jgi:hypothetical protein
MSAPIPLTGAPGRTSACRCALARYVLAAALALAALDGMTHMTLLDGFFQLPWWGQQIVLGYVGALSVVLLAFLLLMLTQVEKVAKNTAGIKLGSRDNLDPSKFAERRFDGSRANPARNEPGNVSTHTDTDTRWRLRNLARNKNIPMLAHTHRRAAMNQSEIGNHVKIWMLQPTIRSPWINLEYQARIGAVFIANRVDHDLRCERIPRLIERRIQ